MRRIASKGEKWGRAKGITPYDVMNTEDIMALPIADLADGNCVLFLWVTCPLLPDALRVMGAWGFTYKTKAFCWVKQNPTGFGLWAGLGYWTRGNTEDCLLGVKGKLPRKDRSVYQALLSPVMEHSHKPSIVRERIVQMMGDLPRIELFARQKVEGWDCWGNEVESDITL